MSNSPQRRTLALALAAVLTLAACGSSDDADAGPVAADGMVCSPASIEPEAEAPEVEPITEAPSEVETEDIEVGEGCTMGVEFPWADVNMVGATADGTVFVDTWADGRPISIGASTADLLPALGEALGDLKIGGTRKVVLPAADAYGEAGLPALGVGPNEAVSFIVQPIRVTDERTYCRAAQPLEAGTRPGKPETIEMPVEVPTELEFDDITEGDGPEVETGNFIQIEYTGVACSTGAEFDSSYSRDTTLDFTVGQGVVEGMTRGVIGAKKGGVRRIVIPSDLAYGTEGQGTIAPNEALVFVVTIVEVLESDPNATTTTAAAGATTTTAAP